MGSAVCGFHPTRCACHVDRRESSRGQASCGEREAVRSRNIQLRGDPDKARFFLPAARQRARRRIAPSTRGRAGSAKNACVPYVAIVSYSSAKRKCIYWQLGTGLRPAGPEPEGKQRTCQMQALRGGPAVNSSKTMKKLSLRPFKRP